MKQFFDWQTIYPVSLSLSLWLTLTFNSFQRKTFFCQKRPMYKTIHIMLAISVVLLANGYQNSRIYLLFLIKLFKMMYVPLIKWKIWLIIFLIANLGIPSFFPKYIFYKNFFSKRSLYGYININIDQTIPFWLSITLTVWLNGTEEWNRIKSTRTQNSIL